MLTNSYATIFWKLNTMCGWRAGHITDTGSPSNYKGWFANLKEPEGVSWLRNWILNTSWIHLLFQPEFTAGSPLALKGISCQTTGAGRGFLDEEQDFALRIHELDKGTFINDVPHFFGHFWPTVMCIKVGKASFLRFWKNHS